MEILNNLIIDIQSKALRETILTMMTDINIIKLSLSDMIGSELDRLENSPYQKTVSKLAAGEKFLEILEKTENAFHSKLISPLSVHKILINSFKFNQVWLKGDKKSEYQHQYISVRKLFSELK